MSRKESLLFLPGALGLAQNSISLLESFNEYHEVFSIDYPGHGMDTYKGSFSIEYFADFVSERLDANDPPWVFGYSMGGYIALYLALLGKSNFKGIMTYGTKFSWNPESSKKETGFLNPVLIKEKVPSFASYLSKSHSNWESVCERTADLMIKLGNEPLITKNQEGAISCPLLVLRGTEDHMVSKGESEWASQCSTRGRFLEFQNGQHTLDEIDPKILTKLLLNLEKDINQ